MTAFDKSPDLRYVYIAGPMRGYEAYNFPAFFAAEDALLKLGSHDGKTISTFNPARNDIAARDLWGLTPKAAGQWLLDNPAEFSIREALHDDTAWISKFADVVCVLPGWERSKGAQAEVALARALGIEVWAYSPDGDLLDVLDEDVKQCGICSALGHTSDEHTLNDEPDRRDYSDWKSTVTLHNGESATIGYPRQTITWSAASGDSNRYGVGYSGAEDDGSPGADEANDRAWKAETRTASSTGGEKGVKLARYDLIPVMPLRLLAEHYGRGAAKYADHQWRRGYEFSKSISAKQRHFEAWRGGEDYDVCPPDGYGCRHTDMEGQPFEGVPSEHGGTCFNHTGSHHLTADLWHSMFLLEGTENWPEHDDRFIYPKDTHED